MRGGRAERRRQDLKRELCWQRRALHGPRTPEIWDHDPSPSRMLNEVSHPGAPQRSHLHCSRFRADLEAEQESRVKSYPLTHAFSTRRTDLSRTRANSKAPFWGVIGTITESGHSSNRNNEQNIVLMISVPWDHIAPCMYLEIPWHLLWPLTSAVTSLWAAQEALTDMKHFCSTIPCSMALKQKDSVCPF